MAHDPTLYVPRGSGSQPWRLASLGALAALVGASLLGCSDDPHLRTSAAAVTACGVLPGELPRADCSASTGAVTTTSSGAACSLAPSCGDATTCLPLAANEGRATQDFRLRRLNVVAPAAFTSGPVQDALITERVDLDAKQCGEQGTGLWNWLLRVDRAAGTLTMGGAPPSDPAQAGYCFARFVTPRGHAVAETTARIGWAGSRFTTLGPSDVRLPIFHTQDLTSAIVLPIHDVTLADVLVSGDGNCIGAFNRGALDANCSDYGASGEKWSTAGAMGGYVTLEEADDITLPDLSGESLCVVLLGGSSRDPATQRCVRDARGKLPALGDYCSATKTAGACRDSVWFAATFAASAVRIHDGAGVATCSGVAL